MTDKEPNLAFLLKEEVQSVMYIYEVGTKNVLGLDIVTKNHKLTITTNSKLYTEVESWNEPLPKNTQPNKE